MRHSLYDLAHLEPLIEAGYVLLTPNFRLARRIKTEWDGQRMASGEQVWPPLSVYPLQTWLMQQWEQALRLQLVPALVPLSAAQELELWQQVIAQEEHESGDYHLLRPSAAAELASQARDSLVRWEVDMDDAGIRQAFNLDTDCGTFLRWLMLFEQRLAAAGQCTPVDCLCHLLANAAQLSAGSVALVDFDDIPPLSRSAVEALCEKARKY